MTILKDLNIPRSGSVENAKLLTWLMKEGVRFSAGDPLYEVETDKVATEVDATESGILVRQLASEGDEHKVGDRVGLYAAPGASDADIQAALKAFDQADVKVPLDGMDSGSAQYPSPVPNGAPADRVSPLVRRLAKEKAVDLVSVEGTGPGGRITPEDVAAAASQAESHALPAGFADVPVERLPMSMRRKTIARRLSEAAAAPTLTADMQIDLTNLFLRREAAGQQGQKPGVLAIIAQAVCALLSKPEHADLNATFTPHEYLRWQTVNLGIAVDTDDGLVVPVIHAAQTLSCDALSHRIAELAKRARDNALLPDELEGGTFTLSNPGSLGPVIRAEAILNTPQVALLGLPAIMPTPVAIQDGTEHSVQVRRVVRPSLTFDHRAFDGGKAISFLNALRIELERP